MDVDDQQEVRPSQDVLPASSNPQADGVDRWLEFQRKRSRSPAVHLYTLLGIALPVLLLLAFVSFFFRGVLVAPLALSWAAAFMLRRGVRSYAVWRCRRIESSLSPADQMQVDALRRAEADRSPPYNGQAAPDAPPQTLVRGTPQASTSAPVAMATPTLPHQGFSSGTEVGGLALVAVVLGGLMFLLLWLLSKPLLHGQMEWLMLTPLLFASGVVLVSKWQLAGSALVLTALFAGFVFGPAYLKHSQLADEKRFATGVQRLLAGQEGSLTKEEAIRVGWDMCAGLRGVDKAPSGAFSEDDPALTVARIALDLTLESPSAEEESQMLAAVHLADKHLC